MITMIDNITIIIALIILSKEALSIVLSVVGGLPEVAAVSADSPVLMASVVGCDISLVASTSPVVVSWGT